MYLNSAFGLFCVPPGECFLAAWAVWGALGNLQVTRAVAGAAPRWGVCIPGSSAWYGKLPCWELLLFPNLVLGQRWKTVHVEKWAGDFMAQIVLFRGINTCAAVGKWNPALQQHKGDELCPCLGWASCTLCSWRDTPGTPWGHPPQCLPLGHPSPCMLQEGDHSSSKGRLYSALPATWENAVKMALTEIF